MADLQKEYEEAQSQWYATRRVGNVSYDLEHDTISIDIEGGLDTYDIAFDRIKTPQQFTEWMLHLSEKKWMTGQHYRDFLECLEWIIHEKTGQEAIEFYNVGGSS
ncbi:MAG TPA: hypothetical protein VF546_02880 [Pyrinomonadaceae bacterium]|jgi:hypothetical protein